MGAAGAARLVLAVVSMVIRQEYMKNQYNTTRTPENARGHAHAAEPGRSGAVERSKVHIYVVPRCRSPGRPERAQFRPGCRGGCRRAGAASSVRNFDFWPPRLTSTRLGCSGPWVIFEFGCCGRRKAGSGGCFRGNMSKYHEKSVQGHAHSPKRVWPRARGQTGRTGDVARSKDS